MGGFCDHTFLGGYMTPTPKPSFPSVTVESDIPPPPFLGPLMGGPQCRMSIFRKLNVSCLCLLLPQCHLSNKYEKRGMSHVYFYPPCCMSLSPMSHVEFKKCPCRALVFRGQGPHLFKSLPAPPDIQRYVWWEAGLGCYSRE